MCIQAVHNVIRNIAKFTTDTTAGGGGGWDTIFLEWPHIQIVPKKNYKDCISNLQASENKRQEFFGLH